MILALRALQTNGYQPRVVIDGGANRGQWFGLASSIPLVASNRRD